MAINPRMKSHSFNESYYRNKFEMKARELFRHLERYPNDLETKGKIKFINDVLEKNDSDLPIVWNEWEKNNFYWESVK